MRSRVLLIGLLAFCSIASFAQSGAVRPQPSATPPADGDVVKITTNLIQLDVTVVDRKGKVVTDLKPEEIEIYQNGEKQPISNFTFISAVRAAAARSRTSEPTDIPEAPITLRPEQVKRTIALVVDDLHLSFDSVYYVRKALKKFVDEQMQDGDLVAILRVGAGIGALQQFTSDKRMLYTAIDRVRWNPMGASGVSVFEPIQSSATPDTSTGSDDEQANSADADIQQFRNVQAATGTLGALKYVVNGMAELPGRKSVMLFSAGFDMRPDDTRGPGGSGVLVDGIKQLIDAANRSSVVFYAVDPRGLVYTGLTAADDASNMNPQQMSSIMSTRSKELSDTQYSLRYLTSQTGGYAVVNNNDIADGLKRVLEDQSYYLVGYIPDTDTFDRNNRRFNKLEVKVLRPGLTVRYRSGFINQATTPEGRTFVANARATPANQMIAALTSPFKVNGIELRLNALFGTSEKDEMYVRSLLYLKLDKLTIKDLPDGRKKATLNVLGVIFGDNGMALQQAGNTYELTMSEKGYEKALKEGIVYSFTFPIKNAGAYQYRVAVRDAESGALGSANQFIEVPDIKKKRLTLSGIVLESFTPDEWKAFNSADAGTTSRTTVAATTAKRQVSPGSVLRYGYEIYYPKLDDAKRPNIQTRLRIFRDGKPVLDGEPKALDVTGQTDMHHLRSVGALSLGSKLEPGDYVLQVIVIDTLRKKKEQISTQYVQFEVQ